MKMPLVLGEQAQQHFHPLMTQNSIVISLSLDVSLALTNAGICDNNILYVFITGGEDISFIDGGEAGVVPDHVPNAFTLCGVGPSSNETFQSSDTVRGSLERNSRSGRAQGLFGLEQIIRCRGI